VLFVGRLVERKGIANLLRAAAGSRLPYRVALVGFGPEEARLRSLAAALGLADRVEFAGRVSDAELSRRYAEADVFVLPATIDARGDTEGLGVVLLEALAHGLPVVATRRGGIPDIVIDGETGLLVEDGDAAALARAIERLLADPALARRLAERGADHVRSEFGVESVARRLAAIYRAAAFTTS
jgi:glycosyltransferase involved in cell wall biosynthesis